MQMTAFTVTRTASFALKVKEIDRNKRENLFYAPYVGVQSIKQKLLQFQTQVKVSTTEIPDTQPGQHSLFAGSGTSLKTDTEGDSSETDEIQ